MNKTLSAILVSLLIFSCNQKSGEGVKEFIGHLQDTDKMKEVKVNQYSLSVPDYMTENKKLNEDASLQYANVFKEFYVIVIDETHGAIDSSFTDNFAAEPYEDTTLFGTFANFMSANYTNKIENVKDKNEKSFTIAGMPARQISFNGNTSNLDIFYNVTFVEGKKHYYQIFTWTMSKYKEQYLPEMDKMISTFKEV